MSRKINRVKHRAFIRRAFKHTCGWISALGFMFMLGTVGSMDLDIMPLGEGAIRCGIGLMAFAGAAYLGGFMK